jgi:hypothetical protein
VDLALLLILIAPVLIAAVIPAVLLKALAGYLFVPKAKGVVRLSIGHSVGVGFVTVAGHIVAVVLIVLIQPLRAFVISLTGIGWSIVGLAVLAVYAVTMDYRMVLRRLNPPLTRNAVLAFLALSNLWVLGGALLIALFNANTLFGSCFDPGSHRVINTFSEPRPENCEEVSD